MPALLRRAITKSLPGGKAPIFAFLEHQQFTPSRNALESEARESLRTLATQAEPP
jgi:hypothetical protein